MIVKNSQEQKIKEALTKHIDTIYPSREALEEVLKSGKKLTIYWGTDPTGPDIHLGHSTNFFVLRRFQNLGHKIVILIGDYTAQIGDPSGIDTSRKILTEKEVKRNYKTYKQQILKILDPKKTIFRLNSEWWNKMSAKKLLKLDGLFTHQQIIERDMFERRIEKKLPISFIELQYPLLQGYDSVALDTDMELGATDQLFNMLTGRYLVKTLLHKEKFVITTPLLINPKTGKKLMSKSEGNYISLNDSYSDMYGKIMALPDGVILTCFTLCTDLTDTEIAVFKEKLKKGENPRNLKAELAYEIVKMYHGDKKAKQAAEEFERVFKKHKLPENIDEVPDNIKPRLIIELLMRTGLASSRSDARRKVLENAVRIDDRIISDPNKVINVYEGMIVQYGKRNVRRIIKKK